MRNLLCGVVAAGMLTLLVGWAHVTCAKSPGAIGTCVVTEPIIGFDSISTAAGLEKWGDTHSIESYVARAKYLEESGRAAGFEKDEVVELLKKDKKSSRWLVRRPKERQKWWVVSLALRPVSGAAVEDKQHQRETKFAERIREIVAEPGKSSAKMAEEAEQEARDFGLLNLTNSNARTANNRASEKPIEWGNCTVIQGHPCFANESGTKIAITDSSDASVLGILLSGLATSAPPGLKVDVLESFGEKPNDYHKVRSIRTRGVFWVLGLSLRCDNPGERQDSRPTTALKSEERLTAEEELNREDRKFMEKIIEENRKRPLSEAEKRQDSLIRAIEQGKLTEVEGLLKNRANVNAPGSCGRTPLYMACDSGRVDVVKLLLDKGADLNAKPKDRPEPLASAVFRGHIEIAKLLLDKGADANASGALSSAASQGRVDLMKLLLEKGADVNAKDWEAWTPLMTAMCDKPNGISLEVVKLLVEKGADANAGNKNGETVLHLAVGPFHPPCPDVVKLLLDNGAKINSKDVDGSTPLMTAAAVLRRGDSLEVVKLLLDRGADVNAKDHNGKTAFHEALQGKQPRRIEALDLLLSKGAKINVKYGNQTPRMAAKSWGDKELLKWLEAHGADKREDEGLARGMSCYDIGYRFARCFHKSATGNKCDPEDNLIIPDRCSQNELGKGREAYFNTLKKK